MALLRRASVPISKRIAKRVATQRPRGFLQAALAAALAFILCAGATPSTGAAQETAARAEQPQLKFGAPQRTGAKEISVKLEFSPEGRSVRELRVEIAVSPGSWQYRRARAAPGLPLAVSARQQRDSGAQQAKPAVLLLTISSRKDALPSGTVAELVFSWSGDRNGPQVNDRPALEIRKLEAESSGEPPAAAAPLEPPTLEPPANPAPTCFFFTH
jgi:hypothetical protein